MKNVFDETVTTGLIDRINNLNPANKAVWGKMNVSQMLAHCNVTYELIYDNKHPKPNAFKKFILKLVAKPYVVTEKPYKKNGPTGPQFIIKGDRDFEAERKRLIEYIRKTQQLGADHFDGLESHSFGVLSKDEWNTLFYKHLDHHLTQFGA